MRTFLLGLIVGTLVISALAAMPQASKLRETIWLGTELTLGMAEDTAIKNLAESNYRVRKIEPPKELRDRGVTSMWLVDEKREGNKDTSVGVITFASGVLESAEKALLPPNGDELEFGRQLYFAMQDLELEGDSHCTVETRSSEVPEYSRKTAKLHCGKKTIRIDLQKFKKEGESVQINESLDAR